MTPSDSPSLKIVG